MSDRHVVGDTDQKQVATGEVNPLPVRLFGASTTPITSYDNGYGTVALDIHDADVHSSAINRVMHRHTGIITTLTVAVAAGGITNTITVASAVGFNVGDYLHINTTTVEPTHPQIVAIVGNVFTLDRYLDEAHAIGDEVESAVVDFSSVAGTISAPIEYYAGPPPGEVWHITRMLFEMTHGTAGDLGLFGDLVALNNGVLLRTRRDGQYRTFSNWKDNGDIKTDMYNVDFDTRSGGGGAYGPSGRGTFKEAGAVFRLDGDTTDRVEVYIQDDLTALASFTMKIQGHLEDQ